MNYEVLIAELQNDPANIGYAAMTDNEVAVALHAQTQTARRLVPLWEIKKLAVETGAWLAIKNAAESHAVQDIKNVAITAVDYINDFRFENLNVDLESSQTMLGALVAGGVVTQGFVDAVDALANTPTSRAAILGITGVSNGHVTSARQLMGN